MDNSVGYGEEHGFERFFGRFRQKQVLPLFKSWLTSQRFFRVCRSSSGEKGFFNTLGAEGHHALDARFAAIG